MTIFIFLFVHLYFDSPVECILLYIFKKKKNVLREQVNKSTDRILAGDCRGLEREVTRD
jgi:hypothetical protein